MSEEREIPKHWKVKRLGELCDLQNGVAFKSSDYIEKSNTLIFRMSQIRPGGILDLNHNSKYLPDEFNELYKNYLLQDKDIVIAMTDMASDTKILGVPTYFKSDGRNFLLNQRVGKLFNVDFDQINDRYLRYALTSPTVNRYYKSFGKGALQINLGKNDILNVTVPVPPLPEQHAIVSKIEELLSDLENGKQQLLLAQQQLKIYRQSLLKWAFEGKLTNKDVKDGEFPKGWKLLRLKDITLEKVGLRRGPFGSAIKKEFFVPDGFKVYEQGNAINNDPYRGTYFVNETKYKELINFDVKPKDLIVSCSGVTLGRICEIPSDAKPGIINQALLRIRLRNNLILNNYFIHHFRGAFFQKKIFDQSQGTAMPNLVRIKDFKEIEILVPPLVQQQLIVDELESKLTVCDKIEETISQSLLQSESLRQSILKKAFEGKLV